MYNENAKGTTPMNRFYKLRFAVTSMAPITGAYALNRFIEGQIVLGIGFIVVALLLMLLCWALLTFAAKNQQTEPFHVKEVELADKEILAFLIAYLLPIISRESFDILANPLSGIFVLFILLLCIYNSNAFHFNPLLAMVGYHFYEVKTESGIPYMLITRNTIRNKNYSTLVKELSTYVYLDTGKPLCPQTSSSSFAQTEIQPES